MRNSIRTNRTPKSQRPGRSAHGAPALRVCTIGLWSSTFNSEEEPSMPDVLARRLPASRAKGDSCAELYSCARRKSAPPESTVFVIVTSGSRLRPIYRALAWILLSARHAALSRLYGVLQKVRIGAQVMCGGCGRIIAFVSTPQKIRRARRYRLDFGAFKGSTLAEVSNTERGIHYLAWLAREVRGEVGRAAELVLEGCQK